MNDSVMRTYSVPALGTSDPATLWQASKIAMRVVVRNVGGAVLFLALDTNDLADAGAASNTFQLALNAETTLVLAPGQTLCAAAQGAGGSASCAISEAMPLSTSWGSS